MQKIQQLEESVEDMPPGCGPQQNLFYLSGKRKPEELPTLTRSLVGQQLVAFLAAALKAAHCVSTHVIAPPIVKTALINVCEQKIIKKSGYIKSSQKEMRENES